MQDGAGTETRGYDAADRLLSVTRGGDVFSYLYDQAGNVSRRTYPGGIVADYAYDDDGRLASVTSGGQATSYAYDAAGNPTLPAGNGYAETRAYDRAGRLTEVENARDGSVLSRFQATLDPVGNPLQVARTGALPETQTYGYDAGDRLTSVCFQAGSCPGGQDPFVRWTYDAVGNRLSEERPAGTTSYTYNAADELTQAGSTTYDYDENGNETRAGATTFTYDLENRLKTLSAGGQTTSYAYDGDGVRLHASTAGQETRFLWDVNDSLPQLALERDGEGSPLRRYLYGLRRISMTEGSATSYYHYDRLGSVVNLTSSTGATQWTWSYEPYGSTRTEIEATGNQPENFMRFTGEYLDASGLYHLRARQYDPPTARFLQIDPAAPDLLVLPASTYAYAANQPTVFIDPTGLHFVPAGEGEAMASRATSAATLRPEDDYFAWTPDTSPPIGAGRLGFYSLLLHGQAFVPLRFRKSTDIKLSGGQLGIALPTGMGLRDARMLRQFAAVFDALLHQRWDLRSDRRFAYSRVEAVSPRTSGSGVRAEPVYDRWLGFSVSNNGSQEHPIFTYGAATKRASTSALGVRAWKVSATVRGGRRRLKAGGLVGLVGALVPGNPFNLHLGPRGRVGPRPER